MADSSPPFFTRYGFSRTGDPRAPLEVTPYAELCTSGILRATVVASAIDIVGGLVTRESAGTDATFTSDLSLRIPAPGRPTKLVARGRPLRTGRRLVTTSVSLETEGELYAYGETTFTRIPRPLEEAPSLDALSTPLEIPSHPLERPLDEEVGIESVDPARGEVRLVLRSALLNPEGAMQGALVALVVECAALARAEHALGPGQVVSELDLRYLAPCSAGPVVGRARFLGRAEARLLHVELFDAGRDDRLTTTALARVVGTSHSPVPGGFGADVHA